MVPVPLRRAGRLAGAAEAAHGGAQGGLVGGVAGAVQTRAPGVGPGSGGAILDEQRLEAVDAVLVLVQDVRRGTGSEAWSAIV